MSNIFAHTRRIAAASAASMLIAGMAHAGVELKLGNDKVAATSVTFSVSQQPVYDPITYMPVEPAKSSLYVGGIYVTRTFDTSSVKVIKHVVNGTSVPAVEIAITADGSADKQVWTLNDAVLNNYSTYTGENSQVVENFDITYKTATLKVYTNGATTPSDTVTWNAPEPAAAVAVEEGGH
ncbi:MAG: type VI secretion system tube protein Hcp [Hyphomonas sp.]|uniref:type VI secretion system tube protein Hcp n=1 Tax=Hyphomonas sp. TaxID=87 RepID=UPI0034A068D9